MRGPAKAGPYVLLVLLTVALGSLSAQRGGRAGGPAGPPPTAKSRAPIDITGTWVSVVTEDWRWRMMTPPKGDVSSIPVNAEARKVAEAWDPARDTAAGEQCKAYGAPGLMRIPGRIRISWENDTTMRVDTEAGTQTRFFRFGGGAAPAATTAATAGAANYQGNSVATWTIVGGRRGSTNRGGSLTVVTTGLRPGYLRKNGVPYSEQAVITEYIHRLPTHPNGDNWLQVITIVEDPRYLSQPFYTSTNFRLEPDGSKFNPTPCRTDPPLPVTGSK